MEEQTQENERRGQSELIGVRKGCNKREKCLFSMRIKDKKRKQNQLQSKIHMFLGEALMGGVDETHSLCLGNCRDYQQVPKFVPQDHTPSSQLGIEAYENDDVSPKCVPLQSTW